MLTTDDKKFLKGMYDFHKRLKDIERDATPRECRACEYNEICKHKNPSSEICMKAAD